MRRRERVNLRWVVGSWVVGALSITAAFVMEHFYSWQGVSLETMVNIGTALLLAGVLFFLQRRFVTGVEEVVSRAAVSAADARIDERVGQVGARLDELEERMNEVLTARRQRQDDAIGALDVPTFESVATALAEANALGALAYDHVTVQASAEITELGLEFSWGVDLGDGRFDQPRRAVLMVRGHVYADERAGGSRPAIETIWEAGDPAEEVGLRIREQLENRGRWHGNGTLNWPMALRNLKRSLDLAVRSRRRDGTGLVLEGALFELVGEEWAITDAGIECPTEGFILRESEFPEHVRALQRRIRGPGEADQWAPTRPDWVDADLWEELVRRGRAQFPIRRGPVAFTPTWIPLREGPGSGSP